MVCSKRSLSYPLFKSHRDNCNVYLTWKSLQRQGALSGVGSRFTFLLFLHSAQWLEQKGLNQCFSSQLGVSVDYFTQLHCLGRLSGTSGIENEDQAILAIGISALGFPFISPIMFLLGLLHVLLNDVALSLPVFLQQMFKLGGIQILSSTEKPREDLWQFPNGKKKSYFILPLVCSPFISMFWWLPSVVLWSPNFGGGTPCLVVR